MSNRLEGKVAVITGAATGIGEATAAVYHGNGAVAQAVHLVEPTGFKPRRHQEYIGTGLNTMGQALIVADGHRDLARIVTRQLLQAALQLRLAAAEDNKTGARGE